MVKNNDSFHFTKVSRNDLDNIYSYTSEELFIEGAAKELLNRMENYIMQLNQFPNLGNRITDEYLRMKDYRSIIVHS